MPDPFFANGKDETMHEVTVPNFYLRIYPDGTIRYDMRCAKPQNLALVDVSQQILWRFILVSVQLVSSTLHPTL